MELKYFLNDKLRKANDYTSAESKLKKMLEGYDIQQPIAVLPDFTDSNTLPIGTTTIVNPTKPINPSWIGMDIGCGYQFFSADVNPKRFHKKGKFKQRPSQEFVDFLSSELGVGKESGEILGTIGKGNHFVDIFVPEKFYDEQVAEQQGIVPGRIYFLTHSGSRKKGFEVYQRFAQEFKEGETQPDDFNERYLHAFTEARKYARANRDSIRLRIRSALEQGLDEKVVFNPLFDKSHNDIQIQKEGNLKIQKGTVSLQSGELFVIPGTAITPAYIVQGQQGLKDSYNTINHGCGRVLTRAQARNRYQRQDLTKEFSQVALNVNPNKMAEEHPRAYKDVEDILNSIEEYDLAKRVIKLKPVGGLVER